MGAAPKSGWAARSGRNASAAGLQKQSSGRSQNAAAKLLDRIVGGEALGDHGFDDEAKPPLPSALRAASACACHRSQEGPTPDGRSRSRIWAPEAGQRRGLKPLPREIAEIAVVQHSAGHNLWVSPSPNPGGARLQQLDQCLSAEAVATGKITSGATAHTTAAGEAGRQGSTVPGETIRVPALAQAGDSKGSRDQA